MILVLYKLLEKWDFPENETRLGLSF
jgi:hypothetical protein